MYVLCILTYYVFVLLIQLPLPGYGMGRLIKLRERITIKDGVNKVKEHIGVPHVRLALARKAGLSKQV